MIPNQPLSLAEKLKKNPFLDGPTETLVKSVAAMFAAVPQFRKIFGESMDTYQRVDYPLRGLPALRVYSIRYTKLHESHYIAGTVNLDVVFPADLRREELQLFQDTLSAAILQQLRREEWFVTLQTQVPGLNEFGKVLDVDKDLGLKFAQAEGSVLPLTQLSANFRIDLKQWDAYLESQGRTLNDPFEVTLRDLESVFANIIPTRDDGTHENGATIQLQVSTQGD